MKFSPWFTALALVALVVGVGCGHLDLTPEAEVDRVVTGSVEVRMDLIPPPDAELVVRIVQPPKVSATPTRAANDLVIGERGVRADPETVVAQQTVRAPFSMPAPFRIEFRATDAQLRQGLNIEARISWGGRLRFRNVESQLVGATGNSPIVISVQPVN